MKRSDVAGRGLEKSVEDMGILQLRAKRLRHIVIPGRFIMGKFLMDYRFSTGVIILSAVGPIICF